MARMLSKILQRTLQSNMERHCICTKSVRANTTQPLSTCEALSVKTVPMPSQDCDVCNERSTSAKHHCHLHCPWGVQNSPPRLFRLRLLPESATQHEVSHKGDPDVSHSTIESKCCKRANHCPWEYKLPPKALPKAIQSTTRMKAVTVKQKERDDIHSEQKCSATTALIGTVMSATTHRETAPNVHCPWEVQTSPPRLIR